MTKKFTPRSCARVVALFVERCTATKTKPNDCVELLWSPAEKSDIIQHDKFLKNSSPTSAQTKNKTKQRRVLRCIRTVSRSTQGAGSVTQSLVLVSGKTHQAILSHVPVVYEGVLQRHLHCRSEMRIPATRTQQTHAYGNSGLR